MLFVFMLGCTQQDTDTGQVMSESSWELEVCDQSPSNATADYQITDVSVEESELFLEVGYSGGCGDHSWSLCWDESFSVEEEDGAEIKHIELTLHHQTNDFCEMFKTAELSFSLSILGTEVYSISMGDQSVLFQP